MCSVPHEHSGTPWVIENVEKRGRRHSFGHHLKSYRRETGLICCFREFNNEILNRFQLQRRKPTWGWGALAGTGCGWWRRLPRAAQAHTASGQDAQNDRYEINSEVVSHSQLLRFLQSEAWSSPEGVWSGAEWTRWRMKHCPGISV